MKKLTSRGTLFKLFRFASPEMNISGMLEDSLKLAPKIMLRDVLGVLRIFEVEGF